MAEQIFDAGSIDELDDYDLTGEIEDFENAPVEEGASEDPAGNAETPTSPEETTPEPTKPEVTVDDDFTLQVLHLKGIKDPSKIKFEDESGAMVERDWKDLSNAEKLNIIAGENGDPERDLEDNEIFLINTLRQNNLTPQQYIQTLQQQAYEQAYQQALEQFQRSQLPTYEIDSLSDDELFALDLLEKVGEENITDEELQEALEQAKSNEALFAKQVEGLRTVYKNLEDQQKYNAEQAQLEQAEQEYQDFSGKVLNEISSFNSFANQEIELSTDDKNDLANYLLTRRDTGVSDFYRDMQDPKTATLAAFWLLRGPEVLNEMEAQIKAAYQRGFTLGKSQTPSGVSPKTPQVVVQQKQVAPPSNHDFLSAFGLEDESYLN